MDISVYNIEPLSWLIGNGLVLVHACYIFPKYDLLTNKMNLEDCYNYIYYESI